MRIALLLSVATAAFATANAGAQTTANTDATAQTSAAGATAPGAQTDAGLQDIIVTAQRREQSLQNAAVAIDAVSGSNLVRQNITEASAITKLVPALTVTNGGGSNTSLYLRGVGNKTSSSWTDPAIAISYDGVFLGRSAGAFGTAFYDLERVEVLKGPQGILYGRNATGGAINIIPAKPELGRLGGGLDVAFANYDTVQSQAHVNLPLGETVALRVAGSRQVHDGYNTDGTSDQDTAGLRAQLLFQPSDALTIRVGGDYTHIAGVGQGSTYIGNYASNGAGGYNFTPSNLPLNEGLNTARANAYRTTFLAAPGFGFLTPLNEYPRQDFDYWGVNAQIDYKTDFGTLTLVPAYRKQKGFAFFNNPAFNTAFISETDTQYSLEARLAGKASLFDYIIGGYYFHETIDSANEYNQEFVLPIQAYVQKTKSWAAFGQLTANVSDRFRLIGGARYTHDNKNMNGLIENWITYCGGIPPTTPPASFARGCAVPTNLPRYPNLVSSADTLAFLIANRWIAPTSTLANTGQIFPLLNGVGTVQKTYVPVIDSGTYTKPTFKGSVEFDVAPRSLLYATVETGYRAGGFQLAEGKSRYNPEFLTAYTIGSKNRFLDNRLQLNLEAFYWRYRDQQITYFTVSPQGTLISSTENAGRMTIKGADVDVVARPLRYTTLTGKVQYLDAEYNNLHLFTASPRDNVNCPFTLTGTLVQGNPLKDFNCSGRPGLFSPKWTVNLGGEQIVPIGQDYQLVGTVISAWRGTQEGGFEYLAFERIPAYWTTDLNLSLRNMPSRWSVAAFVLNLENKRRFAGPQVSPSQQAVTTLTAPRTYGLRLSADF